MKTPTHIGEYKNRIKGFAYISTEQIAGHPENWKEHGSDQLSLLRRVMGEIGWGTAVLVRETDSGYQLVDGALRTGAAGDDTKVPALILDITEEEHRKFLATLDPLVLLGDANLEIAEELTRNLFTDESIQEDLRAALSLLDLQEPINLPPAEPKERKRYEMDETNLGEIHAPEVEAIQITCPKCGHEFGLGES